MILPICGSVILVSGDSGQNVLFVVDIAGRLLCCVLNLISTCLLLWFMQCLARDTKYFPIFLIVCLGNDIQLALTAIFLVIVSKKCVKHCVY